MSEPELTIEKVDIADAKSRLASLVNEVSHKRTRVLVEQSGLPVAAIISIDDLERFSQLEREQEERFAVIDRMRDAFKDVSSEEIAREAERSLAAARERRRQRAHEATARSA